MKKFWNILLFPFRLLVSTLTLILKSLASVISIFGIFFQLGFAILSIISLYTFIQGFTSGEADWNCLLYTMLWIVLAASARKLPGILFEISRFLDRVGLYAMFN